MKKILTLLMIGLGTITLGGCIFADGYTFPRTVTLSVPSADYGLRTEWHGRSTVLHPLTNQIYRFEIPSMACGTTYWLFFIPQRYAHGENDPFLVVSKKGKEWKTLTPKQINHLPKDEAGTSILDAR
jgi:hypothetical protein